MSGTASASFCFGGLPRRFGAVADRVGAISFVLAQGSSLIGGISTDTLARLLLSLSTEGFRFGGRPRRFGAEAEAAGISSLGCLCEMV